MTPNDSKLPPLKDITTSGTYILKAIRPKDDKIANRFRWKTTKDGKTVASCSIFFLDNDGNCLTQFFDVGHAKGLAMLVGRFSGKFSPTPPESMDLENLFRFVEPIFGKTATVELEVTPAVDRNTGKPKCNANGKPYYNYKFKSIAARDASIYGKPSAPAADDLQAPDSGAIPF
jgi:hypothetical protein